MPLHGSVFTAPGGATPAPHPATHTLYFHTPWARHLFRSLGLLILLANSPLAPAVEVHAQRQEVVEVYHGPKGSTVSIADTRSSRLVRGRTQHSWVLPVGSEVCLNVLNPNPVLYTYGLSRNVDTTKVSLPDITPLIAVLQASIPGAKAVPGIVQRDVPRWSVGAAHAAEPLALRQWAATYTQRLRNLALEIDMAQRLVATSDTAEASSALDQHASERQSGFAYAQYRIGTLSAETGHFQSKTLEADLEQWYRDAQAEANSPNEKALLQILRSESNALLKTRNALLISFADQPAVSRQCGKVGTGTTTLALTVARRDTARARAREVGENLVQVQVVPEYPRPRVELVPIGFMAFADDVPSFSVEDNLIRERRGDESRFRTGGMLLLNAFALDAEREFSLGAGLGFGIGGGGKVISDFLAGPVVSYRDLVRIGFGYGRSQMPDRLKAPARVGDPPPANIDDLNDLVETRNRNTWSLIFGLSGLKLPDIFGR